MTMEVYALSHSPAADKIGSEADVDYNRHGLSDRALLGQALRRRSNDILAMCQTRYVAQADDMTLEMAARHPMWDITSLAVTAIADWLEAGVSASVLAQTRIASLGNAAAIDQESAIAERSTFRSEPGSPVVDDGESPTGVLSVALVTKLNLWWKDATCAVLEQESDRLGISAAALDEARDMVGRSCNSSLVKMAKGYDLELQDLHARLLHLASHDQLTGLANRAVFLAQLETAIARIERHAGGLAVVFIDLDNFKMVNDVYGHASGDELLTKLGERFTGLMRPADTVARFGGDEFVALFEDLRDPPTEAADLAQRLHRAVAEPVMVGGTPLHMTASIGVAIVRGVECRSEDVLARADMAMYRVKRTGRNRVAVAEMERGQ